MADLSELVLWGLAGLDVALAFAWGWMRTDRDRWRQDALRHADEAEDGRAQARKWQTCAEARKAQLLRHAPRQPARTVRLPSYVGTVDPEEFKRTHIRGRG